MNYKEQETYAGAYKQEYLDGICKLLSGMEEESERQREVYFSEIATKKEEYREAYIKMLGWPLTQYPCKERPVVTEELLSREEGYQIFRLQIEILPGVKLAGLFFRYDTREKRPLVIVQHGASGSPEMVSGVTGSTYNYNNMLMRVFEKGVNVFAPQLLLWSVERYGVPFDRRLIDARLKRLGGSVSALEVYGIRRAMDYLETLPDVKNFGMVGMSYGGCFTQMTAACDTRIKAAFSCSFFCDSNVFIQTDLCQLNEKYHFGQAEVACLVHPRTLMLAMGDHDEVFESSRSEAEFKRIGKLLKTDEDWVSFRIYSGNHEFYKGDTEIERLIEELSQ